MANTYEIGRPSRAAIAARVLQAVSAEYTSPLSQDGAVIKDSTETLGARVAMRIMSVPVAYLCSKHAITELLLDISTDGEAREFVVGFASRFLLEMEEYGVDRNAVSESIARLLPLNDAVFSDGLTEVIPDWIKGVFGEPAYTDKVTGPVNRTVLEGTLGKSLLLTGVYLIALYCRAMPVK